MNALGRREPSNWKHVDRYSLTPATTPASPVPVVLGINWYVEFDNPAKFGNVWWVARNNTLTAVRGGHCICLEPHNMLDSQANWHWFDQVSEGICVSEGWARCMALLNRKRYQPRPLYDKAQTVDEYDDTPPEEGTSVRAGGDVARTVGMWPAKQGEQHWYEKAQVDRARSPVAADGVTANRWARNADPRERRGSYPD